MGNQTLEEQILESWEKAFNELLDGRQWGNIHYTEQRVIKGVCWEEAKRDVPKSASLIAEIKTPVENIRSSRARSLSARVGQIVSKHSKRKNQDQCQKQQTNRHWGCATDLYKEAGRKELFIPRDKILEHFTGIPRSTWGRARARLKEVGWECVRVDYGWLLTPPPPISEPEPEETFDLLKEFGELLERYQASKL